MILTNASFIHFVSRIIIQLIDINLFNIIWWCDQRCVAWNREDDTRIGTTQVKRHSEFRASSFIRRAETLSHERSCRKLGGSTTWCASLTVARRKPSKTGFLGIKKTLVGLLRKRPERTIWHSTCSWSRERPLEHSGMTGTNGEAAGARTSNSMINGKTLDRWERWEFYARNSM